jgi:predicted component of type VI protein secretion system
MDEYYVTLAAALRERLAVISDRQLREQDPTAHLEKLRQASERIEQLKRKLPLAADPMLTHYLDRMSLSKALEFVQDHYLR